MSGCGTVDVRGRFDALVARRESQPDSRNTWGSKLLPAVYQALCAAGLNTPEDDYYIEHFVRRSLSRRGALISGLAQIGVVAAHIQHSERLLMQGLASIGRAHIPPVADAFHGSNSGLTRSVLSRLEGRGPPGLLAAACFRAQKASNTGKRRYGRYTRKYSDHAYARKREQLQAVASILAGHPSLGLVWGWGDDDSNDCAPHVLYVDLPVGQVSWHAEFRGDHEYPGEWDGQHRSEQRIIRYCETILMEVPEVPRRSVRKSVRARPETVHQGPKLVRAVPILGTGSASGERASG